jgi:hypothetical protein
MTALAFGCSSPTPRVVHELSIKLEDGCPVDVDPGGAACSAHRGAACVSKSDRVRWTAPQPFEIYFDPIRGRSLRSVSCASGVCKTPTVPIDASSPPRSADSAGDVEYKYTVLVDGCDESLDPAVYIQR